MQAFEKSAADLKKGIVSREPDDLTTRLEEEDLLKMNLDEAICGFTDDESDQSHEEVKANEKLHGSKTEEKGKRNYSNTSSNDPLVIENAGEMNQELQ